MIRSDFDGPKDVRDEERNDTPVELKSELDHLETTDRDKIKVNLTSIYIVGNSLYYLSPS